MTMMLKSVGSSVSLRRTRNVLVSSLLARLSGCVQMKLRGQIYDAASQTQVVRAASSQGMHAEPDDCGSFQTCVACRRRLLPNL